MSQAIADMLGQLNEDRFKLRRAAARRRLWSTVARSEGEVLQGRAQSVVPLPPSEPADDDQIPLGGYL